ncbi:hypothetical protein GCM10017655_16550 [Pseudomonas turukhanskensis]|uniref:Autotransporter domain-containing protein n=1 Tax=Pseudomonas turukhanskensis TaxID=1806536 RepID=A0A9W6K5F8_9PSED|nr:hypothetical protein GCM10017655_16550 [Pseudomonas turukhanskensis]
MGFHRGDDSLTLEAGSTITGNLDGGAGNNTLILNGSSGSSDALGATIRNFSTLTKNGAGLWTLNGTVGNPNGNELLVEILEGTLALTGNNTAFNGSVVISPDGTLEARAQSLPLWLQENNGLVRFAQTDNGTYSGLIEGTGAVEKTGAGTLLLTNTNGYQGGTTITQGVLSTASDAALGDVTGGLTLNGGTFNFADSFTLGAGRDVSITSNNGTFNTGDGLLGVINGDISGLGQLNKTGNGTLLLTGTNTYLGDTHVKAGALYVNGDQFDATGAIEVASGATLGGSGTLGGSVTLQDGATLTPGSAGTNPGELNIIGDLNLSSDTNLVYRLGQGDVEGGLLNDLVNIQGNLVLDGVLNASITPGGSYEAGIYRLMNYSGTLTNNGLELGTMPVGNNYVQTSVAGQVNLINHGDLSLRFWDGADGTKDDGVITGGDGVWQALAGNENWTDDDGLANTPFADQAYAVFTGNAGTVTVDQSRGDIAVSGMQFAVDGYRIQGDRITLAGTASDPAYTVIRVGDGYLQGITHSTIDSELTGTSGLAKTDNGILILNGINTYSGDTLLRGGTLLVREDGNLGQLSGALNFDGGALSNSADMVTNRVITLEDGGGTLTPLAGTTLTLTNDINGIGALTLAGPGTTALTGNAAHTGGTRISGGKLQIGNGGSSGSLMGDVLNNGELFFNRSDTTTFNGTVSGTGSVQQIGTGTTVLTADNTYTGGTTISLGTLQLGDGGSTGSLVGDVLNNSQLTFNRAGVMTLDGVISGTGSLTQSGIGVTRLLGNNSYAGTTTVDAGSLYINGNQSLAKGLTTVNNSGTLGGTGTIGGSVQVADGGTFAPGDNGLIPGILTVNGDVTFSTGAFLDYSLGQAGVKNGALNDLALIEGDLTLDGTLNVQTTPGAELAPGLYRLIRYSGALTDNGLTIGTIPSAGFFVQTSIDHEVNLLNTAGLPLNIWDGQMGGKNDGVIDGGDGIWQASAGNDNWTTATGDLNAPYSTGGFALFMAAPGTVTVDDSKGRVTVGGMQFASSGYRLKGDAITLAGSADDPSRSILRVGDGTTQGASFTATIDSNLAGTSTLVKMDSGTLVLNGTNTYTGGTSIEGGTLQISRDRNLGDLAGALSFDDGILQTSANLITNRAVTLHDGGGTLLNSADTLLTLNKGIDGTGALTKEGTGTTLLNGLNTYAGDTTVLQGTLIIGDARHTAAALDGAGETTVARGATLGGYGSINGNVNNYGLFAVGNALPGLASGPQGSFTVNGLLDNAGAVTLAGRRAGNTLTVNSYNGQYGVLRLNTMLGGNASATDRLIIDGGAATGATRLQVNNLGGLGGLTEGSGIQVVAAINGATTARDAFALNYRVAAGPYEYRLYRGAVDGSAADDWFLRSSGPQPAGAGGNNTPEYRREVSDYTALSSMMLQYGRQTLSTRDERVGEALGANGQSTSQDPGWVRALGQNSQWNAKRGGIANEGPSFDLNVGAVQAGVDLLRTEQADGSNDLAGVYTVVGQANGGVEHYDGTTAGSNSFKAASLGAYWTHRFANEAYLDSVLQGTWFYDVESGTQDLGKLKTTATAVAASVEAGKPYALKNEWTVEPQAQVVVQNIKVDNSRDKAADVDFGNAKSVAARVSVKVSKDVTLDNAGTLSTWVRPSVWHEINANPRTTISSSEGGVDFHSNQRGTTMDVTAGFNAPVSKNTSVFGTVGYQQAVNSGLEGATGSVGVRVNF